MLRLPRKLLAALFLAAAGLALSPECKIIGCQHRAEAQQTQDRTENTPPVLSNGEPAEKKWTPENTAEKPPENTPHSVWHLWEETLIKPEAFWAFMVAVITLALVVSTVFLWLSTRKMAKIATRALTELERPFVYVEILQRGFGNDANGRLVSSGHLIHHCINLGRTPADIWDVREDIVEIDKGKWPDPIVATRGPRSLPPGIVAAQEKPYISSINLRHRFGEGTHGRNGIDTNVFFIGYVRYADIFGNRYITGFCAIHDPVSWEFVLRGGERYNYTKAEKRFSWWDPRKYL